MEFIIGAVVAVVVIGYFLINKKMNKNHEDSALPFPVWLTIFYTKDEFDKNLMAKSLLVQALFLAETHGVIKKGELNEIEKDLYEDPVGILNYWVEIGIDHVKNVYDQSILDTVQARFFIMLMIIVLNSRDPEQGLRDFIERTANL